MRKLKLALITMSLLLPLTNYALLPVIDVTNVAKSSILISKAAVQIANQTQMIKNQISNLKQLPGNQWQRIAALSSQLDTLNQQNKSLLRSLNKMNGDYERQHPNLNDGNLKKYDPNQSQQYSLDTMHASLSSVTDSAIFMSNQKSLLHNLHSQSQGANGQIQAIQTANNIALANVEQLQNIQKLIAAQTQAQIARNAQKAQEEHYVEVMEQKISDDLPSHMPAYKNNPDFGLIKDMH